MVIGIDIRALQTGHKYRGIGEVAKQVTNRVIAQAAKDKHRVLFYEYDDDDPKALLTLPKELEYDVIKQGAMPEGKLASRTKSHKLRDAFNALYGHPITGSEKTDVFLQFDYAFGVPRNTRTVLIKHDLIPLVFHDSFFESAWVPFKNRALRTTLRTLFANYKFMRVLRRSLKNAAKIVTVSNSTKRDIQRFFHIKSRKIKVAHLGVDVKPAKTTDIDKPANMPTKPFLLFVGAGDQRRRVDDLVDAYNNLKAAGHDIQLVLVGENFKEPTKIPNKRTRDAVLMSSYKNDILTMGYVDDATKQKLFHDSIAFVYPTLYEGFGIPVLEAFLLETAVITYKNSSIPEVGGDYAMYVRDWSGIITAVEKLLVEKPTLKKKRLADAKKYAEGYTWDKTAATIYGELKRK